jgi:drug/metabolite transporter (DMT)-like permease
MSSGRQFADAQGNAPVLAALLVTWLGVTASFIGLKLAVVSVPPFILAGSRYVVAGSVLLVWWLRDERFRPHVGRQGLAFSMLSGALLIFACQGSITWAVQYLQPGIVAVIASTVPLWVALLSRVLFGAPLAAAGVVGLVAGFGGVVFLVFPSVSTRVPPLPALVVTGGALCWAIGSLVVARSSVRTRPVMVATLQMLTGGAMQFVAGLAVGEAYAIDPARLDVGTAAVFLLLLVVPSLVGYPVFAWLLAHAPAEVANTQAYVAPVITLTLGWLLLGLPVSVPAWIASAVILGSVALMLTANGRLQDRRAVS